MEFRVLGTLEVIRHGSVATPTAPKLRQVLALLAMRGNSLVQNCQLVDELWEDRPPVSSSTTLQTYIYQLRKLLDLADQDGPCALYTRPSGYLLKLPQSGLDVRRFEDLADRGAEEMCRGNVEAAADTLRGALALWRGPVLSDVTTGPVLQAEAVQLEERRNTVLEMRIDADLALGRYQQLISELTGYTTRHPTHEGMHGRLMVALYRAGRRTESLAVFQRVREALAEELGLEPGPELQRIHRQVLASDAALDSYGGAPVVATGRPGPLSEPPAQLPPDVTLVGRDSERVRAEQVLLRASAAGPATLSVVGAPGMGTTSFGVHIAHRVRHAFPDGQFYASFSDTHGPEEVLAGFLRAVGVPAEQLPTDLDDLSAMFRSWTADRKVLLVLDNITSVGQLTPLAPAGRGCATIATGVRRLWVHATAETVELRSLSVDDSVRLLAAVAGEDRVRQEPDAVETVIRACAGVPLALRAAGAKLALRPHWRMSHLADRLRVESRRLRELSTSRLDVRRSVERRCRMLPRGCRDALARIAGYADHPVSADEVAALLGTDHGTAEGILEHLTEHHIAEVDTTETDFRYCLNPLLRLAVQAVCDHGGTRSGRAGGDRLSLSRPTAAGPVTAVPTDRTARSGLSGDRTAGSGHSALAGSGTMG